jgi:hypothetical protein
MNSGRSKGSNFLNVGMSTKLIVATSPSHAAPVRICNHRKGVIGFISHTFEKEKATGQGVDDDRAEAVQSM